MPADSLRRAPARGGDEVIDFPLCRDPRHEAAIRRVLVRCLDVVQERLGSDKLVALVLTGSFARGEGSVMSGERVPRVLGDIEFLAVLPGEVDFHRLRGSFPAWSEEASRLASDEVRVDIEFGPVEIGYLARRARPSIFVYDLIRHGKVIAGRADILGEVPAFTPADIPPHDAVHLVFNRLIEQLEAYDRAAELDDIALWDVAYQRTKLVLDLAGSALAFRGRHEPSYASRPRAFARLLEEEPALALALPPGFLGELDRAARLKLVPGDGRDVLPPHLPPAAQRAWVRERIVAGVPAVASVLRWELEALLGMHGDLPPLLARWMRRHHWTRRAWDWTKVALHPVPAPVPLARIRAARRAVTSTPRALLYTAGALAYLNLHRPTARPSAIARLLFVRRAARRDPAAQRQTITLLWRWCVRNT
ncbi:MAG: hypothetical protein HYU51_03070 [Candidatus Rokubacteria bacterium]|nr:hypothetical protein [Candidatus Rokubacteria bacterium]